MSAPLAVLIESDALKTRRCFVGRICCSSRVLCCV